MTPAHGSAYDRELTDDEIAAGDHRALVGGHWEELGRHQFEFLTDEGLDPTDRLLDIGCGALRGGIHFIRYLEPGRYHGIDSNASLVRAGLEVELPAAGIADRRPRLLVDDSFEFARFGTSFDVALAQSLFTHLPVNSIERCLVRAAQVLERGARLYATYFEAPEPHHLDPLEQLDGIVTRSDADPYHYHFSLFPFLVSNLPLRVTNRGAWDHPRGQHMLVFERL